MVERGRGTGGGSNGRGRVAEVEACASPKRSNCQNPYSVIPPSLGGTILIDALGAYLCLAIFDGQPTIPRAKPRAKESCHAPRRPAPLSSAGISFILIIIIMTNSSSSSSSSSSSIDMFTIIKK